MNMKEEKLMYTYKDQMPARMQQAIDDNGFTVYEDVLVVCDETKNRLIFPLVDVITKEHPDNLKAIYLDPVNRVLDMVWDGEVPVGYEKGILDTEFMEIQIDCDVTIVTLN